MDIIDQNIVNDTELKISLADKTDEKFGFYKPKETFEKIGWLINMHPSFVINENRRKISAVDYYFIQDNGHRFKISLHYSPYFYLMVKSDAIREVVAFLNRKFASLIHNIEVTYKEDLDKKPDHLVGAKCAFIKVIFLSISDLIMMRSHILPLIKKNKEKQTINDLYLTSLKSCPQETKVMTNSHKSISQQSDIFSLIIDIREYDVPYYVRVSIDKKIFVGHWYSIKGKGGSDSYNPTIVLLSDMEERPDPIILAFDIETTKSPLKFPDKSFDQVMMISYVIDGQGFLITNRQIVSEDIEDFEYTPKPEFEGFFKVFNEPDEVGTIKRFISHILVIKPHIFVTYNGDNFDWPFIEARAAFHGVNLMEEIGFQGDEQGDFLSRPCIHMDCLKWVKRDSYLPIGSQGLKAVAKIKLDYDPSELDPEEMCKMAMEKPKILAAYSVSDALATYHLYIKYIHSFIFSLCTIVPMDPDDVLRKGSGTLCEALLMVQAFHANIIYPNKHVTDNHRYTSDGYMLEQETYIGGHVEAIESGIFRSDIPLRFKLDGDFITQMINNVGAIVRNTIEHEENVPISQVVNFEEVCDEIVRRLYILQKSPNLFENPKIYHLDVAAMYPNIILTNRLQPYAIVNENVCAKCPFNQPSSECQRPLKWIWRQEFMPANRSETQRILLQLENENFLTTSSTDQENEGARLGKNTFGHNEKRITVRKPFHQLPAEEQTIIEKQRLRDYCRKAYKKLKVTREEEKFSVTCQRENPFYIDTIRAFRDRRYDFKNLVKLCNKKIAYLTSKDGNSDPAAQCRGIGSIEDWENKKILYDSLQLAHKCILNSFYGYVMRKGARWFSMEMAGIVCLTGAFIIKEARSIIEKIGRPLELDTDGIWCALPSSLPENFTFETTHPKKPKITVSFIGALLNLMVREKFTNHQYQELVDSDSYEYEKREENSIFFEVDGPYYAMILPSAKEEGKRLKKRYAVFSMDKRLAECKGFEVKRRGELPILKIFQTSVFEAFLKGTTLEEVYQSVAEVADYWLDFLYGRGSNMSEQEIFELISENRNMSKRLDEYGERKSASVSTAKRLAEFLGDQMVKDKGLNCKYVIMKKPEGAPVTERAIPCVIFQADEKIKRHYLKKWLKLSNYNPMKRGNYNSLNKSNAKNGGMSPGDSLLPNVRADVRLEEAERMYNIVDLLDWEYYIERLGSAIQKIITIPAAMQQIKNPVSRVPHPEWLHKKLLTKNDIFKQKKIDEMFGKGQKRVLNDIEDTITSLNSNGSPVSKSNNFRKSAPSSSNSKKICLMENVVQKLPTMGIRRDNIWKCVLGPPPLLRLHGENNFETWLIYHKKKWRIQLNNRKRLQTSPHSIAAETVLYKNKRFSREFVDSENIFNYPWHVIQVSELPLTPGLFKIWALVDTQMMCVKLSVPRIFYVNQFVPKLESSITTITTTNPKFRGKPPWEKVSRSLPRAQPANHLYKYVVPENIFQDYSANLVKDLSSCEIEGVYETQLPLLYRLYMEYGCMWEVNKNVRYIKGKDAKNYNQFEFDQVKRHRQQSSSVNNNYESNLTSTFFPKHKYSYLPPGSVKYAYLYQYYHNKREMWALAFPLHKVVHVYIMGQSPSATTFTSNQASTLYNTERLSKLGSIKRQLGHRTSESPTADEEQLTFLPYPDHQFHIYQMCSSTTEKNKIPIAPGRKVMSGGFPEVRRAMLKLLHEYKEGCGGDTYDCESRTLKDERNHGNDKTIIALQTTRMTTTNLSRDRLSFVDDIPFPVVRINKAAISISEQTGEWTKGGISSFVKNYLDTPQVLDSLLEHSKNLDVPIGNIPSDPSIFGCDLIYGRKLHKYGYVLWASPSDKPDLGGKENDDNCSSYYEDQLNSSNNDGCEVNEPGFYTNICLEMDMTGIPINCLLQYHHLLENEGTSPGLGFDATLANEPFHKGPQNDTYTSSTSNSLFYDELASNSETFRILRSIIQSWIKDVAREENVCADNQLIHFYRWVRSPSALLYEPSIKRTLQRLIHKMFFSLMIELKNLGVQVVYGNLNRILICSKKKAIHKALAYTTYITNVLRNHPIFHGLNFSITSSWSVLMWLGPCNYGGMKVRITPDMAEEYPSELFSNTQFSDENYNDEARVTDSDDQRAEMNWNIANYIPATGNCHYYFNMIIAVYIMSVHDRIQQEITINGMGMFKMQRNDEHTENNKFKPADVELKDDVITSANTYDSATTPDLLSYCQSLISNEISEKLFTITQKVQRADSLSISLQNENGQRSLKIPLPGQKSLTEEPALILAKSICHVLNLDKNISVQVGKLKRNLLKLLKVGEFSEESEFYEPCTSFVLREVICKICNYCHDLDLCKDININEETDELFWKCVHCQNLFDKDIIENLLVGLVNEKFVKNSLQDLVCLKCDQVKDLNMATRCRCSGTYKLMYSPKELISILQTFKSISVTFKMDMLEDVMDWVLKHSQTIDRTFK